MGWFSNLRIGMKLMIGYAILCFLMLGIGFMGFNAMGNINEDTKALYYDSLLGISGIKDTSANIEHVRLYMQRMVLPEYRGRISELENEINASADNTNKAVTAYEAAITSPDDMAMVQELKKVLADYREKRNTVVSRVKGGNYEGAQAMYSTELNTAAVKLLEHLKKMNAWNEEVAKNYIKRAENDYNSAKNQMIAVCAFGLLLSIVLGYFITRSIVGPLNILVGISNQVAAGNLSQKISATRKDEIGLLENAVQGMVENLRNVIKNVQSSAELVSSSSEELTASAEQSAQAANSVATAIMEVAQGADKQLGIAADAVNTAEKMSAEAEQIAANANVVSATSEKTAQSADKGRKSVETAIEQMASIQKTVENLAQEITGLGMRSKEIGQIVETISGIAGQTNLLALNAAIEAARAGEQGRGFAVVAEEVRKLAEQSQEAAKQISNLIGGIQDDTNKAVQAMEAGTREVKVGAELVDNAGVAFKEIAGLIEQTTNQVREISESINQMAMDSQEIVSGAQEVNNVSKAISSQTQSVSAATEEQLASMEEIAASSQALSRRAEELQDVTKKFVV